MKFSKKNLCKAIKKILKDNITITLELKNDDYCYTSLILVMNNENLHVKKFCTEFNYGSETTTLECHSHNGKNTHFKIGDKTIVYYNLNDSKHILHLFDEILYFLNLY